MAPPYHSGRRIGFTLIEVLVVVAVIAILIAILIPSLSFARERGRTAVCAANLRSIQLSYILYCNEKNSGMTHDDNNGVAGTFWMYLTQEYHSNDTKVYLCPKALDPPVTTVDDPTQLYWGSITASWDGTNVNGSPGYKWVNPYKTGAKSASNPYGLIGKDIRTGVDVNLSSANNFTLGYKTSYGPNSFIEGMTPVAASGGSALTSLNVVQRPSETPFFIDMTYANNRGSNSSGTVNLLGGSLGVNNNSANRGIYPGAVHPDSINPAKPSTYLNSGRSHDSLSRSLLNRHGMAVNAAFADGSARTVKLTDLWTLTWYNNWKTPNMKIPVH